MSEETVFMRVSEVCDLLQISDEKARQWIRSGKLEAIRIGPKTTRVYRRSVNKLIEQGRRDATAANY